ncbi:hypothetical protein [Sphingomonas montanisoli]|uniref:Class I SAM-dependent methyltransferase n=1 Tax=Sphingomonas montanisoli TaxID=2606412 RepID=A0A5D9C668_9SPHN|nr:hypothetical protein [Sphingomonas montanisoli]TZG27348.1 hypothetical protein FYJ91_06995 [Sphingomonas montanisoli]
MSEASIDHPIRELDPFAFFVGHASRIKPLGGPNRGPDPKYGFHTPYFEYRPGPVVFTIRFHDLKVSFGELGIHVNGFVADSGRHAVLVGSSRADMPELMREGTEITVRINAVRGVTYALFGFFADGTDAHASGMTITAQELGAAENTSVPAEAFERTRFGNETIGQVSALVDSGAPNFAHPISQPLTQSQLDEAGIGGAEGASDRWSEAFILKVLERYGVLQLGARGLMLGGSLQLAEAIAARGCQMVIGGEDSLPDLPANISVWPLNFAELPDDLRGFDFLFSMGTACRLETVDNARWFINSAIRSLRPGGIAVHLVDWLATSDERGFATADRLPLRRSELTRIALTLISHNHEVAQLNFGGEEPDDQPLVTPVEVNTPDGPKTVEITPFGLIARA